MVILILDTPICFKMQWYMRQVRDNAQFKTVKSILLFQSWPVTSMLLLTKLLWMRVTHISNWLWQFIYDCDIYNFMHFHIPYYSSSFTGFFFYMNFIVNKHEIVSNKRYMHRINDHNICHNEGSEQLNLPCHNSS